MFFVYPFFLIIAMIGLRTLFDVFSERWDGLFVRMIFISFIILNLSNVVLFMVRNHPYQNVYFNGLAGGNMQEIKKMFELDYWGLSFTKAFEYILKNDQRKMIKIYIDGCPYGADAGMLDDKDRKRLVLVHSPKDAEYFISDYRGHKENYPYKTEFYSIKVEGAAIVSVYRF